MSSNSVASPADSQAAKPSYWVMQCPVISTGHLTAELGKKLSELLPGEDFHGFVAAVTPFGGFIACSDEGSLDNEVPACLADALRWCLKEGFEWLRFDSDGDFIPELTTYDW